MKTDQKMERDTDGEKKVRHKPCGDKTYRSNKQGRYTGVHFKGVYCEHVWKISKYKETLHSVFAGGIGRKLCLFET